MSPDDALERTERRLAEARSDARALAAANDRLNVTLREARSTIVALREQLAALATPPQQFAVVVGLPGDGLVDIGLGGRRLRVPVAGELVDPESLWVGDTLLVNEAMTVVGVAERGASGEVMTLLEQADLRLDAHP